MAMISFVIATIIIDFFVTKKLGWGRLLALSALFLVSNLIWFLFGGYMPRQFIVSQAIVLILIYWSGDWFLRKWGITKSVAFFWPMALMIIGIFSAFVTTKYNALNYNSELMFIRSQLAHFANSSIKQIHIIRQKDSARGLNGLPRLYDNLNGTSTDDREVSDLIRVALKDFPIPAMHFIVTSSDYGKPYKLLKDSIVIDMNDLTGDSKWKNYINLNFDPPKNYYSPSTTISPNDFDYTRHGSVYAEAHEHVLAILNYNKAIEINPYDADIYLLRGKSYYKQGHIAIALADFDKAITLNPTDVAAYDSRAVCYDIQGNDALAIQDLDKAISIDPDDQSYLNRGNIYAKLGKHALAMADLNKAIELHSSAENYVSRGVLYGYQGKSNQAIADLSKAIAIDRNNAAAYINRAICYFNIT